MKAVYLLAVVVVVAVLVPETEAGFFESIGRSLRRGVETVGRGVRQGAETVGRGVRTGVSTLGRGVKTGVSTLGRGVKTGVTTLGRGVKTGVRTVGSGVSSVGSGLKSGWNSGNGRVDPKSDGCLRPATGTSNTARHVYTTHVVWLEPTTTQVGVNGVMKPVRKIRSDVCPPTASCHENKETITRNLRRREQPASSSFQQRSLNEIE
ncbi:hypothetical protein V1264_002973 [Littorina saxatilis]|uniref:Uncharacterized protein n=1 Tax=Littorina saxatilis TaxID=31220 RepID=A0AAN9B4F0_9CAEN